MKAEQTTLAAEHFQNALQVLNRAIAEAKESRIQADVMAAELEAAIAKFDGSAAAELLAKFEQRAPGDPRLPDLRGRVQTQTQAESLVRDLETAIAGSNIAAERLLAKLQQVASGDRRLPNLRKKVQTLMQAESLVRDLETAIGGSDAAVAADLLAKLEQVASGDRRLPNLQKEVQTLRQAESPVRDLETAIGGNDAAVAVELLAELDSLAPEHSRLADLRKRVSQISLTNSIGMRFVLIPPGRFDMGSTESEVAGLLEEAKATKQPQYYLDRLPSEAPKHPVRISKPFYMGVTEVTQEEYQRVMGNNSSCFMGNIKRPMEGVTWEEAVAFCNRLSALPEEKSAGRRYGLPTEAQWEYACRAGNPGRSGIQCPAESRQYGRGRGILGPVRLVRGKLRW